MSWEHRDENGNVIQVLPTLPNGFKNVSGD